MNEKFTHCPFLLREDALAIYCDGVISDYICNFFNQKGKKEAHFCDFCLSSNFVNCPIYGALERIHDDLF
jgi:hypothetical protein